MTQSIRPAGVEDWPSIRKLLEERELPIDGAEEHVRSFLIATHRDTGEVVGVAGVERYGESGLVRSVAVASDAAASGLGTVLLRALVERARVEGMQALYLLTTTAAGWFPRFGFTVVSREDLPRALNGSAELRGACPSTAVAMRLSLR